MIMACGSDSSCSMHSVTTLRPTAFVDATRRISASDSIVRRRATTSRVSIKKFSLILLQFLEARMQLGPTQARPFHDGCRRFRHELFVGKLGLQAGQFLSAAVDLALHAIQLLLRDFFLRELDGNGET